MIGIESDCDHDSRECDRDSEYVRDHGRDYDHDLGCGLALDGLVMGNSIGCHNCFGTNPFACAYDVPHWRWHMGLGALWLKAARAGMEPGRHSPSPYLREATHTFVTEGETPSVHLVLKEAIPPVPWIEVRVARGYLGSKGRKFLVRMIRSCHIERQLPLGYLVTRDRHAESGSTNNRPQWALFRTEVRSDHQMKKRQRGHRNVSMKVVNRYEVNY